MRVGEWDQAGEKENMCLIVLGCIRRNQTKTKPNQTQPPHLLHSHTRIYYVHTSHLLFSHTIHLTQHNTYAAQHTHT